jgi:hypothetical protein
MTTERKRSILVISITFLLGIAIGVLSTGLMARKHYRGRHDSNNEQRVKQKDGFIKKLFRVMDANEQQQVALKPLIEVYVHRIDSLQEIQQMDTRALVQELQEKIKPQITAEQYQKLKNFNDKIVSRSRHNPHHSHH